MVQQENGVPKDDQDIPKDIELGQQEGRFLDFLGAHQPNDPNTSGLDRSSSRRRSQRRSSTHEPDAASVRSIPVYRKISWEAMLTCFKKWIRSPANIAIFIWGVFVVIGVIIDGLAMFGMLNSVMKGKDRRKRWIEVINQILNALFMIMCLYQHPVISHHLVLLLRWKPKDQVRIRGAYCKGGVSKPHDRAHMLFVVFLLHLTCIAQYIMCAFFWEYNRHNRPNWGVNACIAVGTVAPVVAGVYTMVSPLGRKYDTDTELAQIDQQQQSVRNRGVLVTDPEWNGGLFDVCDDSTVFCMSFFCTFCVFGWNMERLGFGNMYVHMFTFVLLCVAPILVFGAAAFKVGVALCSSYICSSYRGIALGIAAIVGIGGVLSVLGLIYGGVWRSGIRKKFNLPGDRLCCGYAWATDYMKWLFCWSCSLAQEVRTGNFYVIGEDGFYRGVEEDGGSVMASLPREGELGPLNSGSSSSPQQQLAQPKVEILDPLKAPEQVSVDLSLSHQVFPFGRASMCHKSMK